MFSSVKGTIIIMRKIVNVYWSILRALRTRGMEAIAFVASVKYQACIDMASMGRVAFFFFKLATHAF